MIRVAICHENRKYVDCLKELICRLSADRSTFVFYYYSVEQIVCEFVMSKSVDVLIVDECLATEDNRMVLELFRKRLPECVLVLTTKNGTVNADLLSTKPYRCLYERDVSAKNLRAITEIIKYAEHLKKKVYVWGSVGKVSFKVDPQDIMYVSIAKHGSVIHLNPDTRQGKIAAEMKTNAKLSELFDAVGGCGFSYAHNSYIVNLRYVTRISSTEVEMEDGNVLSVSRSKREHFDDEFRSYWKLGLVHV